jgi:predicted GH43/DUF377 family glycosyl hydrolase
VTPEAEWQIGPFERLPGAVLAPHPELSWASKDLFNPGAVVHAGQVHLLVRGEDHVGRMAGTSRIGLAASSDGATFAVDPDPVLAPGDDAWTTFEAVGGCEDPRVVEAPDGTYVCHYTGFDGRTPTLMVATSSDLRSWRKHGPAFAGTPYAARASKSGAVVTEVRDDRLVAAPVGGRFWMYWGERICFAATSDDLVRWTPIDHDATGDRHLEFDEERGAWDIHHEPGTRALRPLLFPRRGRFDSALVEPGPPAVRTEHGIVLVYNGANDATHGDPSVPAMTYQPGQALFDIEDPAACIARCTEPFLRLADDERDGQVANVCFAEGLVRFDGRWRLYLGLADSRIGCAVAP